ncbi:hypothetical protein WN55_09946 [Dufourea novaeangliae]|uniref:Uncharacterized protein n=1 Tax=Dufourea novaeangliae TaxID=178035 RepID=A0A154P944_DUFNO|nr:hypothetical protein WN55_09946 [Dufourea novaeangliae]
MSTREWFGEDNSFRVLQEVNDPKNCSRLCTFWKMVSKHYTGLHNHQMLIQLRMFASIIKLKLRGRPVFTLKKLCRQIKQI